MRQAFAEAGRNEVPGGHRKPGAYTQSPQKTLAVEAELSKSPADPSGGYPTAGGYGNVALAAGGEILPGIAAAVKIPAVKKGLAAASGAVNAYFTYQMAKGAGGTTQEAFDAYKKGDYLTMAAKLGHAGVEGLLAYTGLKGLAKTGAIVEPEPAYQERQAAKPPSERDPGAGGTHGPVTPEVLQGKGISAERQAAQAPPPPVEPKPATPTPAAAAGPAPLKRQPGESAAAFQARKAEATSKAVEANPKLAAIKQAYAAPAPQPEPTHPAVIPSTPLVAGGPGFNPIVKLETELGHRPSVSEVQRNLKMGYGAASRALEEAYPQAAVPAKALPGKRVETFPSKPAPEGETPQQEFARLKAENAAMKGPEPVKKEAAPVKDTRQKVTAPELKLPKVKTQIEKKLEKEAAAKKEAETKPPVAEPQAPLAETKPAEAETKHKFSTTHVTLPDEVAAEVKGLGAKIPPELLAEDGREADPHITVKYGLHGDEADKVREVLKDQPPVKVKLGETSLFSNPDADVVKIDVDSPDLHSLNKKIADALPHTDTHPDYKPHVTVGYVKPGQGGQFAGDKSLDGREVEMSSITFSDRNGNKVDIPLSGKISTAQGEAESTQSDTNLKPDDTAMKAEIDRLKEEKRKLEAADPFAADRGKSDKKLNLRQKLKAQAAPATPARTAADITPETAKATAPLSDPSLPEATQETIREVHTIFGTAKDKGITKARLQPVDEQGKPTGQPVEMDLAADPQGEVSRVSKELRGHTGGVTIEPLGQDPNLPDKLTKWFRRIDAPKAAVAAPETPARGGGEVRSQAPPEPGSDVTSTKAHRGFPAGTKFMFLSEAPEGYVLMSPSGKDIVVSKEDFKEFRSEEEKRGVPAKDNRERGSVSFRNVPARGGPEKSLTTGNTPAEIRFGKLRREFKNKFVRALSQLQEADESVHAAAVKAETSRAQAAVLMHVAAPRIQAALGPGISYDDFRRALTENVLQGKRQMWEDMSDLAWNESDEDLFGDMKDWMFHLLERTNYQASSPANTAARLLESEDFDTLRTVLSENFANAADRVASVMTPEEYQDVVSKPTFQDGLKVYKDTVEKSVKESHQSNEGVLSQFLGDLDTYIPLIPLKPEITGPEANDVTEPAREDPAAPAESPSPAARTGMGTKGAAFSKPKNRANFLATGLAEDYSTKVEDLASRVRSMTYANNKAAFIKLMEDSDLLQPLDKDAPEPEEIIWMGRSYVPKVVQVSKDLDIVTPKGLVHVPGKRGVVPEWAYKEVMPLLDKDSKVAELYDPQRFAAKITRAALIGPTDVVVHGANLIGTLVARTPFLSKSLVGKGAELFPFVKRAGVTFRLIKAGLTGEAGTDEAAQDLIEMSKYGGISEKFGSETYSPEYAKITGAHLVGPVHGKGIDRISMAPILYGPNGLDINARLMLHRAIKGMNPGASDTWKYLAVNQLGNYTRNLQGQIEQKLKSTMLSPFATAGMTMNRNGINTVAGIGPQIKATPWWQRAVLFNNALMVTATWFLAHKAYRGKWPWEEKNPAKLLKIEVKPEDQNTELGRMICGGSSKAGVCYLDVGLSSPTTGRGFRATGIQGAFDTLMQHGSADQVMDAALAQALTSAASPIMGPPAKLAWLGISGTEPSITGLKNMQGQPGFQFFPSVLPQKPGAAGWAKQHVVAPIIGMNSLLTNIGAVTGLTDGIMREAPGGTKLERLGHLGENLFIPNLATISHPKNHEKFLSQQRKAETSAARKRDLPKPATNP